MNNKKKKTIQPEQLINELKDTEKENGKRSISANTKTTQQHTSNNKDKNKKKDNKIKSNKNKQKQTKINNNTVNTGDTTMQRKWEEKKDKTTFIKGKITPNEAKIITNALCDYAYEHQLTTDQLLNIITEKQQKNDKQLWTKIAECLPQRTVQSVHNFCHRTFHPNNYKGHWSSHEEKELLHLVKEHGKKWDLISKLLERTPTNVKDKYKQLGGDNHSHKTNEEMTIVRKLHLLKEINKYINNDDNEDNNNNNNGDSNNSFQIFKYKYHYNPNLDKEENEVFKLNKETNVFNIDSSLKQETSKCITRNLLRQLLNFENIINIIESNVEISWMVVSNNIKALSADDCRNEWHKLLKEFHIEGSILEKKRDFKMIK